MKKVLSVLLALMIILSFAVTAFAAHPVSAPDEWLTDWDERVSYSGKMWQTPGESESDRVFTWLSAGFNNTFTYSDGKSSFTAVPAVKLSFTSVINTVKLSGLAGGEYTYTYTADGKSYSGSFSVKTADSGFVAAFCSDPQLGRSDGNSVSAVQNDTYGWENTLISAKNNGAELILTTGDQVNEGLSATQYNALFSPAVLKDMVFAPTSGNHDFYSPLFPFYFRETGVNEAGNNYYFAYGNALFIVLDSNNIVTPVHVNTINNAVNAYPDAVWRVVMMHHGAYSSCADDFTNTLCAGTLKNTFDTFDIDLVLSGHNHFYSRTYPIFNGEYSLSGTVYFEAGSASGGKCSHYDTSDTEYIIHSHDLSEASYSLLTFTDNTIQVSSYLTASGEVFDSFTVYSTEKEQMKNYGIFTAIILFFEKLFSLIPVLY